MNDSSPTPCRQEDLLLYHYGELAAPERLRLEEHLNRCADCRRELSQIETALRLLPHEPLAPTPAMVNSLHEKIDRRLKLSRPRRMLLGWSLAASAALLLTLFVRGPLTTDPPVPAGSGALRSTGSPAAMPDARLLLDLELLEQLDLLQELKG